MELKPPHLPLLTAEPEIMQTLLDKESTYLVLACDGVWDEISSEVTGERRCVPSWRAVYSHPTLQNRLRSPLQEAGDMSKKHVNAPKAFASDLVQTAYARGSTDNISVVVVDLAIP